MRINIIESIWESGQDYVEVDFVPSDFTFDVSEMETERGGNYVRAYVEVKTILGNDNVLALEKADLNLPFFHESSIQVTKKFRKGTSEETIQRKLEDAQIELRTKIMTEPDTLIRFRTRLISKIQMELNKRNEEYIRETSTLVKSEQAHDMLDYMNQHDQLAWDIKEKFEAYEERKRAATQLRSELRNELASIQEELGSMYAEVMEEELQKMPVVMTHVVDDIRAGNLQKGAFSDFI